MSAGAAARQVALAGSLTEHEATRRALQTGSINPEQAQVITGALDGLSDAVGEVQRAAVEGRLLADAGRLDPGRLRKEAVAQAARVDPGGSGDLAAQERAAKAGRDLSIGAAGTGCITCAGSSTPRRPPRWPPPSTRWPHPAPPARGGRDPRSPGRRRADALVELARRALAGDTLPDSGGVRPLVVVTMTLDQLRNDIEGAGGCAQIAGATVREPLSAGAARRIACDAGLIPAVLGGPGEVLDWGRARRSARPAQRRALALRDRGCTFPGCDRPPDWAEAHHLIAWERGGRTDLANLTLVCDAHHDIAHHDGWTITLDETASCGTRPPHHHPNHPGERLGAAAARRSCRTARGYG